MSVRADLLRHHLSLCVKCARSSHCSAVFFRRHFGDCDYWCTRMARQHASDRDYWMSRARSVRAELIALEASESAAVVSVAPAAPAAPVVRVVSAVPVAPVQLTLVGGVDPVPAHPVRPSWFSRYSSRCRGRYLPGRCL